MERLKNKLKVKRETLGIALLLTVYGIGGFDGYVHRDGGVPPKQRMYDDLVDDVTFIKQKLGLKD